MALDDETQTALTRLREIRVAADEATQALSETSHTQVSKRKLLSVTVGLSGELQGITFNGESYRKLPPVELATLIVETVGAARKGAHTKAEAMLADVFPEANGPFTAMTAATGPDDFMEGLLRIAGDGFTDEEATAFRRSWRGER